MLVVISESDACWMDGSESSDKIIDLLRSEGIIWKLEDGVTLELGGEEL
jgi:hypothetical protein